MLIKWKVDTLLECIDEDNNDWCESMKKGEEFEVEKIELESEDAENGNIVKIFLPDNIVATSNSNWFNIQE